MVTQSGPMTRSGANHRVATSIVLLLIVIWAAAGCWLIAASAWPDTTGRKELRAVCQGFVVAFSQREASPA
jgi:hypothetical protein